MRYVIVILWVVHLYVEILQVNIIRTGGQSLYNYFIPNASV